MTGWYRVAGIKRGKEESLRVKRPFEIWKKSTGEKRLCHCFVGFKKSWGGGVLKLLAT